MIEKKASIAGPVDPGRVRVMYRDPITGQVNVLEGPVDSTDIDVIEATVAKMLPEAEWRKGLSGPRHIMGHVRIAGRAWRISIVFPFMKVRANGVRARQRNDGYVMPDGWEAINTGGDLIRIGERFVRQTSAKIAIVDQHVEDDGYGWYSKTYGDGPSVIMGPYSSLWEAVEYADDSMPREEEQMKLRRERVRRACGKYLDQLREARKKAQETGTAVIMAEQMIDREGHPTPAMIEKAAKIGITLTTSMTAATDADVNLALSVLDGSMDRVLSVSEIVEPSPAFRLVDLEHSASRIERADILKGLGVVAGSIGDPVPIATSAHDDHTKAFREAMADIRTDCMGRPLPSERKEDQ